MKIKNYLLSTISYTVRYVVNSFVKNESKMFSSLIPKRVNQKNLNVLKLICFLGVLALNTTSYGQNIVPFTKRYNQQIKGDMLLVGNNILGIDNSLITANTNNEGVSMQFIDIDSDPTTFCSSSASMAIPPATTCFKIAYAGLYWGALIKNGDSRTNIKNVKLKLPGSTAYTDITGITIYDTPSTDAIVPDANRPYACYADVTSLVADLANSQGTYTVANVSSSTGINGTTGLSAGWTLVVIYEDPETTTKSISTFDGFSALFDDSTLNIPVSGFITPPSGPTNIKFGFATMNGDKNSKNKFEVGNGFSNGTPIITTERPSNNFFNSSITDINGYNTSRSPNGTNSLGYDTGTVQLLDAKKIGNNATSAIISLQVPKGQANIIFSFFNSFLVNIVAPDISLTKIVEDAAGNNVGNSTINLGQDLYYKIDFQNIGNDNITNFTLKDVLPQNVIFNYPADITSLPTGVTHTYNATTRTLLFTIPNSLVKISEPINTIRLHVKVVSDYNLLSDACSNKIENQAFATYRGVVNTTEIVEEGSFASTVCKFGTGSSTNFLANIDGHIFTRTVVLCGASVPLNASSGYNSYSWSTSSTGSPVIGTGQTYTATNTGVYYVTSTAPETCKSIKEEITVIPYGITITNPVVPFADQVVTCPNNGKDLPNIFLCGANATRLIKSNISDASSIEWQKLDETSCAAITVANCANESSLCNWNVVANGANYLANTAGQFRVVLKYTGGCQSIFYFNVYSNLLNPTVTNNDIICATKAKITIGGVPAGYEYSLNRTGPYQSSNVFPNTSFPVLAAGTYTVFIKQIGVATNPCIFEVKDILIRERNFSASEIVVQPLCNGDLGSIRLVANDARAQYFFSISKGGTLVNGVGPIAASDYTFSNLSAGTYTYEVRTEDGCLKTGSIEIVNPVKLTATAALTKPLTCANGEVTVYPVGGTAPYTYYVNSTTVFQKVPQIIVSKPLPAGGVYTITVVDVNNCSATTSITVSEIPKPVYTVTKTDVNCYGDKTGTINFNVTNANGYTLAYSINNGATYGASATFSGLAAGTYNTILRYTLNGDICFDTMKPITISQPAAAVTASAGVSELAGCGPAGEGRVRITNPQGGTGTYQYSFDNQATWTTVNDALIAPGTYTLFVRDANGCIFSAPVTLDPEPVAPVINVDTPVDFNCDGSATSKVIVNNPGGANYAYVYSRNGIVNTNTPPNEFINVPPGTHKITVAYNLSVVPTFSNLLFENFGYGDDTTSPGMNATFYCFERQVVATQCRNNIQINDGDYSVTARIISPFGPWLQPGDHTPPTVPPTPKGRALVVNIGDQIPVTEILYEKTINNIIPNQPINVEFFAFNLLNRNNNQANPNLRVALVNASGTEISFYNTGNIPKSERWENYPKTPVTLNPGANTTLRFIVRSNVRQTSGNDVAIDDIRVYQLPKTCITTRDFTIFVPTGKAFAAQITGERNVTCAGAVDGQFNINVQNFDAATGFQYSIDNGATFTTSFTSPVTITGLTAGTYAVIVRPNAAAIGSCSKPFSVVITEPTAVTAAAIELLRATCTTGATIRATGGGGTPAYQYELREADGITAVRAFSNNRDFTNVPVGNYTVFVRDANGCLNPTVVPITVGAAPTLTATLAATTDFCYTPTNPATLVVTVTGGTAPFTYKFNSNTPQNSNTFTNVNPGTHTIVVTDSNNCTTTIANIVIAPQLTLVATLTQDLTCVADAVINTTVTGGYPVSYTYTVSYNGQAATAINSFPYTATVEGTYVFTVTDGQNCTATSNTVTVTPKTTPIHTTVKTDVTCNGLSNGTITVTATGGFTSAYSYVLTGPTNVTQTTNQFIGLAAGTYNVKVIDSKGCESVPTQVIIDNPSAITVNAVATTFSCSTTNTKQSATITVTPSGGSGTFIYSYNNGTSFGPNNTLTVNDNGTAQTFQIIVKDSNGCLSPVQTITLAPLNAPTDLTFANAAVTCAATTTTVTVTAINGLGALSFVITGTTSATSPTLFGPVTTTGSGQAASFPSLLPGNYTFRVTDANGCFYTESHTVAPVTSIVVTATKLSDVACFGNNTGSARFTVTGFSSPGNYVVSVTTTPAALPFIQNNTADVYTLTGLVDGTYNFAVTDNTTGCTDFKSVSITEPSAALTITSASATDVFCNNDNSQITITANGGTKNYRYAAVVAGSAAPTVFGTSNVITVDTNSATNLLWDVYVRDANGCTETRLVTIVSNGTPTITAVVSNQCTATGSNFQIVATGAGGLSPYTYTINTGIVPSPADTFTVVAGIYTITVTDANGCTNTTSITVNQRLTALATVTKDITCAAPAEANVRVNVSGGLAPFSYRVRINGVAYSGAPIAFAGTSLLYTATGTTGSTYEFEITDANGVPCTTITNVVTTNTPQLVIATETHVDPTCNGFTDGSIRLTATAGEAPFTYAIAVSPAVPASFSSANVFGGLAAGTYNYIVRDAKGCDVIGTIILNNPAPIVVDIFTNAIQCNINTPGSFDVNVVSGGTAPYTYRLFDNAFTQIATYTETSSAATPLYSFTGLNFGDYYITVVDANGCEFISPKTRIETPPFLQQTFLVNSNNCATGVDVEVTTIGGIGPFRYSIFGQPLTETAPLASNVYEFTGLLHGVTYFLQVKDANDCISIEEYTTPPPPSTINITGTVSTNVSCNGSSNGTLAFTVQDFDPSVTTINYEVLNALTLLPLPTPINGILTGVAGGPFSGNITTLPAGNYVLRATEGTGTLCSASFTFTITQPAQPLTSAVTANVNANCNSGALVTLTTTGGTGPYQYAFAVAPATSTTFTSGNVLTLDPGVSGTDLNWNITVRDANGCTVNVAVSIAVDPSPVIALSIVDKCVAEGTFEILVSETTAGTGEYSISVDGGIFINIPGLPYTVTGLNSGAHTIIIRDANGCTDMKSITIDAPLVTTPAITALPSCADNDGVITMTGTGGTGTYTYSISPVSGTVSGNVISGLPAGMYTITMTDTATPTNCTTTAVVTLVAPTPVTFTTTTTAALCVGDSNGTITVTLGAGNNNPVYTYEIIAPITVAAQSSNIFTGLFPDTYTVRVNSGRGCSADDATVIVASVTPLAAVVTVASNTTCSTTTLITVSASGGTGSGYTYSFNGLAFTLDNTFTVNNGATPGITTISIKDTNGCILPLADETTPALNPPTEMDIDGTPVYCLPAASQTSTVTITNVINGVGTFTYQNITSGTSNATGSFSGLAPGDYLFQVTDANGCTYQELFTVNPVTNITAAVSATTDVTCFGFNNGTATIDVANFGTTYTAILTVGTATIAQSGNVVTLTAMQPGNYTLRVTDNVAGCIADVPVTITQPTAALFSTSIATRINCDNDNSTITITATGGTTNYQYAVARVGDLPPTVFTANNVIVVDTNGGADMAWTVYVTDANGCSTNNLQPIVLDASPTIASALATQCPSPTGTYTITVTATGFSTALQYSADGSNYQTGNVITVNAPGPYTITVKDANGCISAGFSVTILDPLILTPTVTTSPSCADGDGVIAVATTGGSGSYEYRIDSGVYPMTTPFTGIASGSHIIYVYDTTTDCEASIPVTLLAATPITGFALATTPVTCNGGNDGTITATIETPAPGINDNPIYTYTLNGTTVGGVAVNRPSQDSPLFSGLAAGNYTIIVTSERGCTDTETIAVAEPTAIVVPAPIPVQFGCTTGNTGNLATIKVINVTGGTSPYFNYEFIKIGSPEVRVQFGSSNVYTEANLAGGSYRVNVYDSQGCMGSALAPIVIDPYVALDKVNVAINQAITCTNLESITVTATTTGGAATNLEYTLVDSNATTNTTGTLYPSQTNTTGVFTGLVVADYLITVRNLDTNCEIVGVHIVNEPNTFDLTIDTVVDAICLGGNDGSANITFIDRLITTSPVNGNDAGPFTYTVLNAAGVAVASGNAPNAGPITVSGLAAGTYTVTATLSQSPSCTVSKNFTITGPNVALDITETHTEITCVTGNNDGTISVAATGGWPGGYEYELLLNGNPIVAYSTQTEFTGLVAGDYIINVRDSKGCIDSVNVTLVNPTPIAFTATASAALSCFGDTTASITASAPTGGSGSYLYTLITTFASGTVTNNGPQLSNIFTNLGAANYQVKVTDSWGCETTAATIVIAQPALVTASLVLASANTCNNQARLTLTAAGGTAPYRYSVDPNFATSTAISGSSVTFPVAVGTYNYYVRDANGCTSFISNDIKIDAVPDLTITAIVTNDIKCFGDNSGVIVARAQGGLGNYVYTLLDGNGNPLTFTPTQTTAGTFTNLIAGSYLVNVVSGDCQERTTVALVITEPSAPLIERNVVTNVTCAGEGDGKIVITASGGTGVIKYAISPNLNQFFESNVFDKLKPGFYDYIVQDQNGCFIYTTGVEITQPNSIFVTTIAGSEMPEVCSGDADGMFSIDITGGKAPYSVSINNRNGMYTDGVLGQSRFDFSNLIGSEHIVYVRDATGCTTEHNVILGEAVTLNPQATVAYNCLSNSASNSVTITVDPGNNPADLFYSLDGSNSQVSNVFTNLTVGLHTVEVSHINGCIKAIVFGILQVDPLTLTIADGGLNEIVATAAGGIKNYQFSLDGESAGSQSSFIITKSGNYTVTVTDASGCTATATRFFDFIDIKIPNVFTPNGDGNNDTWAPINTINYKDLTFDIFDRYGRRIGKYTEGQLWDGKYNGAELPSGDYWYVIKIKQANDGREFVGHFTLYR